MQIDSVLEAEEKRGHYYPAILLVNTRPNGCPERLACTAEFCDITAADPCHASSAEQIPSLAALQHQHSLINKTHLRLNESPHHRNKHINIQIWLHFCNLCQLLKLSILEESGPHMSFHANTSSAVTQAPKLNFRALPPFWDRGSRHPHIYEYAE